MHAASSVRSVYLRRIGIHVNNSNLIYLAVPVAAVLGALAIKFLDRLRQREAESEARAILHRADQDIANRKREAELEIKENALQRKAELEDEMMKLREELRERERVLDKRQDANDQKTDHLMKQERIVETTQRRLAERLEDTEHRNEELSKVLDMQRKTLHEVTGLSQDEATSKLLELLDRDLAHETGAIIAKKTKEAEETAKEKGREILLIALQRYAAAHTAESTTSTVGIPNDEMKGRIIGREGRNIRSFEKETGVDVIIDDTPGVVVVSGFDPVRREVARLALNNLIADGRIHPTRIEEVVKETQGEVDDLIRKRGQEAAQEVDVQGLSDRLIYLLGRLHFRTSYSQNVLRHSVEVAFLAGMMAEIIGFDGHLARRCGLLHDIGKAADHELEGGHPKIGADILKRQNEGPEVVHAAYGHHDEIVVEHPYTMLVATADACSASRPGARRETLERYIKRMEELESIATEFDGVNRAYAIQAGREIRVIANSRDTDDNAASKICRDIAKAFEERLTFPGEIKVTLIREARFTEIAK